VTTKYAVRGLGKTSFQLETGDRLHMSNVLYVPGLKKNLLSISASEDKGYRVAFVDGHVLAWPKESSIDSAGVIGVREGGLYKLTGKLLQALVHDSTNLSELWHRRFAHLHYRALPALPKMVTGILKLQVEHDGVCRGCALGKNVKGTFPGSDIRSKGILDLIHSDVCGSMTVESMSGCLYYVIFIDLVLLTENMDLVDGSPWQHRAVVLPRALSRPKHVAVDSLTGCLTLRTHLRAHR